MQGPENSFLEKLANDLWIGQKENFDKLYVILPSRRARIFFIEAFKKIADGSSWLPTIKSMEDFISEISALQSADELELIFEFYEAYKALEGDKADSLEEFMGWGSILLYDFNEIDRNLIDPDVLFGYLTEQKAAENWNLGREELTDYQQKYLDFWHRFIHYYRALKAALEKKQIAYQGMLYQEAIKNLENKAEGLLKEEIYCFAGFNAFTPAEESIIDLVKVHRKTLFYWDADEYYLKDKLQEAGTFLRSRIGQDNASKWVEKHLIEDEKELKVYGISGNIGQAKLLGELLNSDSNQPTDLKRKAVILADENLLLPVLDSIPKSQCPLNITMGYPVKQTAFYSFFYSFFQLFQKFKGREDLYYRDLFAFLESAFLAKLSDRNDLKAVLKKLRSSQAIYYDIDKLKDTLEPKLTFLFESKKPLIQRALSLVEALKQSGRLDELEMEILFHFYKLFNKLHELEKKTKLSEQALMNFYRQFISRSQLSFVGEPLEGLQIMGVLESRTLDFEEVYILSMNEGILPSGKAQNSLIPFNIKKEFNLPTYKEKDAIFAYHFYRILQRAKRVHLIYNSGIDPLSGGERSRFIEQLLHEIPFKNQKIKISELKVEIPQGLKTLENERIEKTEAILEKIREKLKHKLSASAINTYLSCPLDFYYKYILGLREEASQDPEEDMEAFQFGNLLHDCLEVLYLEHQGELLDNKHVKLIENRAEKELIEAFKKNEIPQWSSGKNKLVFEVCKTYLKQFFEMERDRLKDGPILIKGIEDEIEWRTALKLPDGEALEVNFFGKIDRIEEQEGNTHIIDYKSGLVNTSELNLKKNETLAEIEGINYSKLIQLTIYKLLYQSKYQDKADAGIISFRNMKAGLMIAEEHGSEESLALISGIVARMLDLNEAFEHNPKAKYCSFCRDVGKSKAH